RQWISIGIKAPAELCGKVLSICCAAAIAAKKHFIAIAKGGNNQLCHFFDLTLQCFISKYFFFGSDRSLYDFLDSLLHKPFKNTTAYGNSVRCDNDFCPPFIVDY